MQLSLKSKKTLKALSKLLIKLAMITIALWLALTFVFGVFRLNGNNMYPMLKDGDLCITYKLDDYYTGDIVAYQVDDGIRFGRIVGRIGDTVDGDEEGLLINGARVTEEIFYTTNMMDIDLEMPVTLGDGEFIVLNDYRENAYDSRTYGVITKDDLKGKVIFIFRRRGF